MHLSQSPAVGRRWPPGSVVAGRFRVERELGRGGMGVVLAVSSASAHPTPLALKILLQADDAHAWARFEREAAVVSRLDPQRICRVYETGTTADGHPFILMERLEGEDLDDHMARTGPMPPARAVDLIIEAAAALGPAHRQGIVHRDIKPSNLFLARTPPGMQLKVLDFGIAKASLGLGKTGRLTGTSQILGTPAYMAPEQLASSREVDGRADVWALGVTLYELLTARLPYEGRNVTELMAKVLSEEPIDLRRRWPEAPPALADVIARALATDPDERLPTVEALVDGLAPFASRHHQSAVANTAVAPVPPAPVARLAVAMAPRGPARRRWWIVPIASAVIAAAGLGAVLFVAPEQTDERPVEAGEHETTPPGPRVSSCEGDDCLMRLEEGETLDFGRLLGHAQARARRAYPSAGLVVALISDLSTEGLVRVDSRVILMFRDGPHLITIAATTSDADVIVKDQRQPGAAAESLERCPLPQVLSWVRARPGVKPDGTVTLNLEPSPAGGLRWILMRPGTPQLFRGPCRAPR